MTEIANKYPVGIQTFEKIREGNYRYVDKTRYIVEFRKKGMTYVFLSRPRRFGKSLFASTLQAYFEGRKELFEGLAIADYEKDWVAHPVLHFDMSGAKHVDAEMLKNYLDLQFTTYEELYGKNEKEIYPNERLDGIVKRAYKQTGQKAVVIIDEYDAPLLDVLHEKENLQQLRFIMQNFYSPLKKLDPYLEFVFITGITKFSQLSIFSTTNNITNVTLIPQFSAVCGLTEEELCTTLWQDVEALAGAYRVTAEEMHAILKRQYDGYHFSEDSPEVYNPFSLLKCFLTHKIDNYWFESGTPTYLIRQLKRFGTDITSLDRLEVPAEAFDQPTENMENALPLLYQSGYLTIKDYEWESRTYTLSFPNEEVRVGYVKGLLPAYIGMNSCDVQMGFALKFWRALKANDIDLAISHMQSYLASIPYVEGFKKKLAEAATAEGFYEYTFYLIFSMLNVYVQTQVKVAGGRVDVVVFMPDTIYVMELKAGGSAEDAIRQIEEKGYTDAYKTDGRRLVKVGVSMNKDTRTVEDWIIKEG